MKTTKKKLWEFPIILSVLLFVSSCALHNPRITTSQELFKAGNYEEAIKVLEEEAKQKPQNQEIQTLLFRAKLNSYYTHLAKAREFAQKENTAETEKEYKAALAIFPNNFRLLEEMDASLHRAEPAQLPPSHIQTPVTLKLKTQQAANLSLNNASILSIFKTLGQIFGINFIFDKDFRDQITSVDIRGKTFQEILLMLCMMANAQHRIVDQNSVFIYPDQPFKKQLFELKGIKVFYLSNIKAEDAQKIIMPLFSSAGQPTLIQTDANLNALIVRADYKTLQDIERFIPNLDMPKSEVGIDVEILEINRNLINKLGANYNLPDPLIQGGTVTSTSSSDTTSATINPIVPLSNLGSVGFYMNIPTVSLKLLESDDNNRLIAKPNLRGLDGEDISYMVGDDIPIPQTQFQGYSPGTTGFQPLTTYQYKSVGVEIKITPQIHHNQEISLKIKMTITFITGYVKSSTGVSSEFPTLGKREIEAKIRLKEGETNIIGGFIRDDIRKSLSGLPALAKIPVLGRLFGSSEKTIQQTDLIFSITPRIIRHVPIKDRNQKPVWLDENSMSSSTGGTANLPPEMMPETGSRERIAPRNQDQSRGNAVLITPMQLRVPANTEAFFSISLQSQAQLSTLSFRGSFQGNVEILDVKPTFTDPSVQTMKNVSGNSFDIGVSFTNPAKSPPVSSIAQIKVKFPTKGTYQFSLEGINALDQLNRPLTLSVNPARIEVY